MGHSNDAAVQPAPRSPKLAKTPFREAVFVCGKCAKKLPGGGGAVKKSLKKALKSRRWGKVRVVETRCLDLCPKRRQVLASHHTLASGRLLVVEPGFEPAAALDELLGAPVDLAGREGAILSLPD